MFFVAATEKSRLKLWFFSCHNINVALLWLILKRYTILEDFFLLDFFLRVRYHDDIMTALKFDWSNLKTLMSGWYRKSTSSCVSFTIYQQCHTNIEGDVTPISLLYQNVHWVILNLAYERRSSLEYHRALFGVPFYSASLFVICSCL